MHWSCDINVTPQALLVEPYVFELVFLPVESALLSPVFLLLDVVLYPRAQSGRIQETIGVKRTFNDSPLSCNLIITFIEVRFQSEYFTFQTGKNRKVSRYVCKVSNNIAIGDTENKRFSYRVHYSERRGNLGREHPVR
jgi:hypothetical protein